MGKYKVRGLKRIERDFYTDGEKFYLYINGKELEYLKKIENIQSSGLPVEIQNMLGNIL